MKLNYLTSGEHLEFFKCDCLLVSKVPLDQILEFPFFELEPSALNKVLEIFDLDFSRLFMLDSEEQSLQEHIVLLLVSELIVVGRLIGLHEVAKLVLSQVASVRGETLHDRNKRGLETLLCLFVVLGVNWTTQKVDHKVGCTLNRNLAISLEVEQQSTENL